ncbi:MAG: hypothetical protein JWM74_3638, partial [Myxococcaceae bacterium]|nr:hypothetical protein [Myxococcaceae bacterium]
MLPSKRNHIRFFGAVDGKLPSRGLAPSSAEAREDLPFMRQEFYVWSESGEPVGPVSVDQIARGILAGRVPLQAFVTRPGEPAWRKVLETREIVRALELSSEVETVDVMDDEEELVEVFDDEDDLGDAIERATSIYDAKELGTAHYQARHVALEDPSDDAGTGHFPAIEDAVEEYRSRESAAFSSGVDASEVEHHERHEPHPEAEPEPEQLH